MSRRVCAALLLSAGGCFLPSFEKVDGGGGSSGGGGGGGDTCGLASPPPAPKSPPPGGEVDFYTAFRTVDLGETHLSTRPGFDLDGSCTCCADCDTLATCAPPIGAVDEACDEVAGQPNAGRDNNAAKFFARMIGVQDAITSAGMTQRAGLGDWSIVARVWQYNGDPDDGQVSVALFASTGSTATPLWNGDDAWEIRRDSLDPEEGTYGDAIARRDDAYVSGDVLVADFKETKLRLVLPLNLVVELEDATFTARIVEDAMGKRRLLDGVIAGAWRMTQAFSALGGMLSQGAPVVCTDTPDYQATYKDPLCVMRDTSTVGGQGPCDAISFGLAFTADPIAPFPSLVSVDTTRLCVADPASDACR